MRRLALAALLAAPAAFAGAAHAQDTSAMARMASANQLGVAQYCQAQGYVGTDVVDAQRAAMNRLPPSTASTADAEAAGKSGTILSPNGQKTTLSSMADQSHTSVADLCKRMGAAATQSAAMMSTMPAMPTMPGGMPQMPAMPAMPGGTPQMPGTPTTR